MAKIQMTSSLKGLIQTLEWLDELKDLSFMAPLAGETPVMPAAQKTPQKTLPHVPQPEVMKIVAPTRTSLPSVEEAQALASAAKTLEELHKNLLAFEGCSLKKTAMNTVFSDGVPTADVMLVGEAPGADEDIQGKPFVGASGKLLDQIFAAIGLTRKTNIYISNVIPWRPPGNRTPTPEEVALCRPFLEKHIALVRPKILVLVGNTSLKAVLQTPEGITRLQGTWVEWQNPQMEAPVLTLPIYHPAFLLRSPGKKRDMWRVMLKLQGKLQEMAG